MTRMPTISKSEFLHQIVKIVQQWYKRTEDYPLWLLFCPSDEMKDLRSNLVVYHVHSNPILIC